MNILVILRMVPDVVEELEIAPDRKSLVPESIRLIPNESDDHALEQALLIKESRGASVSVLALESIEAEDALYSALAKGADKAFLLEQPPAPLSTRGLAELLGRVIEKEEELKSPDLILTGVRTITDLDAPLAPLLSRHLNLPHLGIVKGVTIGFSGLIATAIREYPDGFRGEFEIQLPAVLGVQAAEKPPRYVQVGLIRAAKKSAAVRRIACPPGVEPAPAAIEVLEMRKPRVSVRAEMLSGSHDEIAHRVRGVLVEAGLIQGE